MKLRRKAGLLSVLFLAGTISAWASKPVKVVPLLPVELAFLPKSQIAPHVKEALESYPAARDRFIAGLPRRARFLISFRHRDAVLNPTYLAWMKVEQISAASGTIEGEIFEVPGAGRAQRGDSITIRESQIIDWKIINADGSVEGDAVGRFIASLAKGTDVDQLTEDQREADIREIGNSPLLGETLEKSILQFFDDPTLRTQRIEVHSDIPEWPDLAAKFHDQTFDAMYATLTARAAAVRAQQKVTIEKLVVSDSHIVLATFNVGFKKGARPLIARQIIQFRFTTKSKKLDTVTWGLRTIEALSLAEAKK